MSTSLISILSNQVHETETWPYSHYVCKRKCASSIRFFGGKGGICPVVLLRIDIDVRDATKHNKFLLVPSVDVTCFGSVAYPQALKYITLKKKATNNACRYIKKDIL